MRFAYTYRSSDGQRHVAEIDAESRDAAFAKVRAELGIKPIKVTAVEASRQDGGSPSDRAGARPSRGGMLWGAAILAASILALLAFGIWRWAGARDARPYLVMTPRGPVTYTVATPLPRQAIPGDRRRIEQAIGGSDRRQDGGSPYQGESRRQDGGSPCDAGQGVFRHAAERWLARYAEPGRGAQAGPGAENGLARTRSAASAPPSAVDFEAALREPIRIASTDFTEVVDLKRIVAGMKREMRAYLAGGGTAEQYVAELEKRQRLEISYRERAEQRLNELLKEQKVDGRRQDGGSPYQAAYAYWLKANAQLQAMGIYPLALPDALRSYQMNLDIDE